MEIKDILSGIQSRIQDQFTDDELPEGVTAQSFAAVAGESVMSGFTQKAQNGDFSGIQEMFSGSETPADHPVLSGISPDIVRQISGKLGIDPNTASSLVARFMPSVMNVFNQKSSEGSFDIQSIIGQFSSGGIGDIISQFTGSSDTAKPGSSGGGIMNMIKGLFGR